MLPSLHAILPGGFLSGHFAAMSAIVFIAALMQGISGLGFAMVSAPVAVLFFPELVPGPLLVLGAGLALLGVMREFSDVDWPSTGALIQAQIGATNAAGMDVFAACSGFLYGLTLVEPMIKTGQIRYALVIGAEVLTKYVDYTARGTCVIFGDGAGAAVVGPVNSGESLATVPILSRAKIPNLVIGTVDTLIDAKKYPLAFRVINTNQQ